MVKSQRGKGNYSLQDVKIVDSGRNPPRRLNAGATVYELYLILYIQFYSDTFWAGKNIMLQTRINNVYNLRYIILIMVVRWCGHVRLSSERWAVPEIAV